MTFAVVGIQARMSSTRLPGKSLADVAGQPLLRRVVDRARAARRVQAVVVLTSREPSDDELARYCAEHEIAVRRGSLHDVYARYLALANEFDARYIVRVTGDCPLIDPEHIDAQLDQLERYDADFAPAQAAEHLYPGQGALSVSALRAAAASGDPRDREHVGSFFFARHPEAFRSVPLLLPRERIERAVGLRLCVDEAADLAFVRRVFERFAPEHGSLVPLELVLEWLSAERETRSLNADVRDSADNCALRAERAAAQERLA